MEAAPLFHVEGGPPVPVGEAVWVRSRAGDRLRAALFTPAGVARGSVVLSGGRTEFIEKYGEVVGELLARGFVVLAHDWVGQGLSARLHRDPLRGHIRGGARRFLGGFDDVIAAFVDRLPRPWIAFGHSMGAALTALSLTQAPARFDAAVLCSPMSGVQTGSEPEARARMGARVMSWLGRGAALPLPEVDPLRDTFDNNVLTHDRPRFEQPMTLIRAHPELRLGGITWAWLRFAFELHDALARPGVAERVRIPVAVLVASEEKLVDNAATRRFAGRLPEGELTEVEGALHEITMETDDKRAAFWRAFDRVAGRVAPTG